MGHQVIIHENSTIYPQQVVHLPLALPPSKTEKPRSSALQNAYLIPVGQLCDDVCQAILNKKSFQVLDNNKYLILTSKQNK